LPFSTPYVRGQGRIFRMWPVKLRPGVSTEEFERFLNEDWVEVFWSAPRAHSYVLKGNRGTEVGHYLVVAEFDRVHTRDLYWPETGESDLWNQLSTEGLATRESIRAETDGSHSGINLARSKGPRRSSIAFVKFGP